MQRFKADQEIKQEESRLQYVIDIIKKNPRNIKLLKASELKGKKAQMPTNLEKLHEIAVFKLIEPNLFKPGHFLIQ
jgi:predicted HTH domain antitoxin